MVLIQEQDKGHWSGTRIDLTFVPIYVFICIDFNLFVYLIIKFLSLKTFWLFFAGLARCL